MVTTTLSTGAAADPVFHPTYARVFCTLLKKQGVETQQVLAKAGLAGIELLDADRPVSLAVMRKLILAGAELSGSMNLGMSLGGDIPVSAHGPVGYAAVASRDIGQALDVIVRYSRLRSTAVEYRSVADTRYRLQMHECCDLGEVRIPILEAALITTVQLIESMLGQVLTQAEYAFPYPAPAWKAMYHARFGNALRFDAPYLELSLPHSLLASPCVTADRAAHLSARRDCEQAMIELAAGGDTLRKVRLRLRQAGCYPTCEAMAADLNMSTRTLMRKLKQHGSSYQELLDEARKEQAAWYLAHSSYPIETIAERLGYIDTSNFSRTFRRWFGVSPKAYRQSSGKSATP